MDFEETGYVFGVQFEHPMGDPDSPAVFVRFGGTWNHLELENEAGDIVGDTGHGLGWEAGAGLAFPLGERWRLTPGVRYRSAEREFGLNGASIPAVLRYVAFEIGFRRLF